MKQVTCTTCGWVHMGMPRVEVDEEVRRFNTFYEAAPEHVKQLYHQHSSVEDYMYCFSCGASYLNMREAKPGDGPARGGFTIQPILLVE